MTKVHKASSILVKGASVEGATSTDKQEYQGSLKRDSAMRSVALV